MGSRHPDESALVGGLPGLGSPKLKPDISMGKKGKPWVWGTKSFLGVSREPGGQRRESSQVINPTSLDSRRPLWWEHDLTFGMSSGHIWHPNDAQMSGWLKSTSRLLLESGFGFKYRSINPQVWAVYIWMYIAFYDFSMYPYPHTRVFQQFRRDPKRSEFPHIKKQYRWDSDQFNYPPIFLSTEAWTPTAWQRNQGLAGKTAAIKMVPKLKLGFSSGHQLSPLVEKHIGKLYIFLVSKTYDLCKVHNHLNYIVWNRLQ